MKRLLLGSAAFLICLPVTAYAGGASFHHGVVGVKLSERVGPYPAWSPDGSWLAVPAKSGPRLRNVETGKLRQLHAPPFQGFPVRPGRLDWAPDGKTIRYATSLPREARHGSWLTEVPLDGSEFRQQSLGVKVFETAWAPSGWPFAFTTGPYAYEFEKGPIGPKPALLVVDRFGEAPHPIVQIQNDTDEASIDEAQFSPNGRRILFSRTQRHNVSIWTVRLDGSGLQRLWTGLRGCQALSWSPRGYQIALLAQRRGELRLHPYVLPARGGKPRRIGNWDVLDGPVWSPDGSWLTFSNYQGEIRRARPDGSGEQVIATSTKKEIQNLLWSPDGRHLAYTADEFAPD